MKKTSFILVIAAAVLVCVWLLRKSEQLASTEATWPIPPAATVHHQAPVAPTRTVESSSSVTMPETDTPRSSNQAWIDARSASLAITQAVDPVTKEPVGTIKVGSASGSLGETPPFYRLQLKTTKHPILVGDKDTRHHFVRIVDSVHVVGGEVTLVHQIAISYPRKASLGGIVFRTCEDQITQLGVIVPEIIVPAGYDPTASQYAVTIRVGGEYVSSDDLAKAMSQPLGPDTVLVMPTHPGPPPTTVRVLWLALDANGSFRVARN